jgi:hypothetical protein
MFFSFAGGHSVCPWAAMDYFPGECVAGSHMVHDAHLFFCCLTQANLEQAGREKCFTFFSVAQFSMG